MLRINPAVRLIPPSTVVGDHWMAENLLERRRYRLSASSAAALVAACRPREPQTAARQLADVDGLSRPVEYWAGLIEALRKRALIVDQATIDSEPSLRWLIRLRRDWSRFGWHEAAEYHALSFDYPCVDYSVAEAIVIDRERMLGYQALETDEDRYKLDYSECSEVPLPDASADLQTGSARTVWSRRPQPAKVDFVGLTKVLSLAFGVTGMLIPRTNSAPLLRRSSPSGGARNPSEGYLVVRDVPGLEPGWYHVTIRPSFGLRGLDDVAADDESLTEAFPETMRRFPRPVRALVVITSLFERNMYRYREPRTFRTVHMDAGHIAGSVRIVAHALGLSCAIYYCDLAPVVERAIGVDGLREGYMLTVALGDGDELEPRS